MVPDISHTPRIFPHAEISHTLGLSRNEREGARSVWFGCHCFFHIFRFSFQVSPFGCLRSDDLARTLVPRLLRKADRLQGGHWRMEEMWILRVRADWLSWDVFHFHFHFLFMCFQRTCVGGGKKGQEAFGCHMFWHVLSSFWACGSYLPWHPRQLWILKDSGCGRKKIGWRSLSASMEGFQLASRWGCTNQISSP